LVEAAYCGDIGDYRMAGVSDALHKASNFARQNSAGFSIWSVDRLN